MRWIATQSRLFVCVLCVLLLKMGSTGRTDERVTPIIEFGDAGDQSRILSTHAAVSTIEVPLDHWLGKRVRAHVEAGEWPEIAIQPEGRIDWSAMGQLVIPVRNPGVDAVNLLLRVDAIGANGADQSRSGIARVRPREELVLVLPLQDND